jgi:thiol-disulfide isomerase/thioredoxin
MTAPQPTPPPPPTGPFPPAPGPPGSGSGGNRKPLIVVAVVVALVLIAAGLAIALSGGSGSKTSTGASSDSSSAAATDDSRPPDTGAADSGTDAKLTCESGKTADESKGKLIPFSDVKVAGKALPTFSDPTGDPAVGKEIPFVTGHDFEGNKMSLSCPGQPSMIMFVAHWCPHCQREVPALTKYWKENGLPKGVKLVSVATGSGSDQPNWPPQDWLKEKDWPVPVMADSTSFEAASAFGLSGYPYFVMVDKDGKVAARFSGEVDPAELDGALKKLAAGKDPLS